jgi:gliding motility-associated-like protein
MLRVCQLCFASHQFYKTGLSIILIFLCLVSLAQPTAKGNRKPKIIGQNQLATDEEQPITIQLSDLQVEDRDNWFYPLGFTLKVYPGTNYSVDGNQVTPDPDLNGKLIVTVTVNDGEDDSDEFGLEITVNPVNDKPVITANATLSTDQDQSLGIKPDDLTVVDPDNQYPADFTLRLLPGDNYSTDGNNVIPASGFTGALSVNVVVNDGSVDSDPYVLQVQVNALAPVPEIVGQVSLQIDEDETISIALSDLTVVDGDNSYPQGFSLQLAAGSNYTISANTVVPVADFFGKLSVPVTVNDGTNTSKPFNLTISVIAVNDLPEISKVETDPILYASGNVPTPISQTLVASDADGDSIMFAEVGFRPEGYHINSDQLIYTPAANSKIRGVFDVDTGILTLLGQASPGSYTKALRSVFYNVSGGPFSDDKTIYLTINDGKTESEPRERALIAGNLNISLEIPTGFTPNGDLANDTWKIIPLKSSDEYTKARIKVYNKAGSVVFESIGFDNAWDGRMNGELLPAETYFYTIDLNLQTTEGYLKGVVTILR